MLEGSLPGLDWPTTSASAAKVMLAMHSKFPEFYSSPFAQGSDTTVKYYSWWRNAIDMMTQKQWEVEFKKHIDIIFENDTVASNLEIISDFFRREYLSRLWIIQESKLARDLVFQCREPLLSISTTRGTLMLLELADYVFKEHGDTS